MINGTRLVGQRARDTVRAVEAAPSAGREAWGRRAPSRPSPPTGELAARPAPRTVQFVWARSLPSARSNAVLPAASWPPLGTGLVLRRGRRRAGRPRLQQGPFGSWERRALGRATGRRSNCPAGRQTRFGASTEGEGDGECSDRRKHGELGLPSQGCVGLLQRAPADMTREIGVRLQSGVEKVVTLVGRARTRLDGPPRTGGRGKIRCPEGEDAAFRAPVVRPGERDALLGESAAVRPLREQHPG